MVESLEELLVRLEEAYLIRILNIVSSMKNNSCIIITIVIHCR